MTQNSCHTEHSLFPQGDGAGTTLLLGWGYHAGTTVAVGAAGPFLANFGVTLLAEQLPQPATMVRQTGRITRDRAISRSVKRAASTTAGSGMTHSRSSCLARDRTTAHVRYAGCRSQKRKNRTNIMILTNMTTSKLYPVSIDKRTQIG